MASSATFASFSILISLAILFMSIDPSFAHHHHHHEKHSFKLKKICSNTSNSNTCMKLMKSDSRTDDADSRGLIEIAIDLALAKAKDIHSDLNSLSGSGSNSSRDRYTSCSKNYNDAIRNLEQSKRLFNDGDYKRIPVQISDTVEEVRDCKNQLEKLDRDSSDLKMRNKEFLIVCEFAVKASSKYSRNDDSNDDNC